MGYWRKWSTMSMDMCKLENYHSGGKFKPMTLLELYPAFFVLAVGLAVSSLAFLLELVVPKILSKFKSSQPIII